MKGVSVITGPAGRRKPCVKLTGLHGVFASLVFFVRHRLFRSVATD
jgi:hypothetical protein